MATAVNMLAMCVRYLARSLVVSGQSQLAVTATAVLNTVDLKTHRAALSIVIIFL